MPDRVEQFQTVHRRKVDIGDQDRNAFAVQGLQGAFGGVGVAHLQVPDGAERDFQCRGAIVRVLDNENGARGGTIVLCLFHGMKRYPTPCMVTKWRGVSASGSSFCRSRTMCASTVRVLGNDS